MKYAVIFLILFLFSSCEFNSQSKGYENYKNELSEEAIVLMTKNSPFALTDTIIAEYKYYTYYQEFGNSGLCIQYELNDENKEEFHAKIKSYKHLMSNLLSFDSSNHIYVYNDEKSNIKTPELNDETDELWSVKANDVKQIDVYVIKSGMIKNAFKEGGEKLYNYSVGIYHFKNRSTCIYWFLLY